MGESPDADPFLAWVLAAFHTTLLVTVAVLTLHLTQGLNLLDGVGTGPGIFLFLALWGITWWTNRRLLGDLAERGTTPLEAPGRLVERGVLWGGATGALFLWVLLGSVIVQEALEDGLGSEPLLFLASIVGIGGLGTLLALLVGGAVGGILAALDWLVMALARRAVGPVDDEVPESPVEGEEPA